MTAVVQYLVFVEFVLPKTLCAILVWALCGWE